jgi:hypothetical protein
MLTALQLQVARVVADLPEAEDFVLAGGAALIAHNVTDRATMDLDFFATSAVAPGRLLPALEAALEARSLMVERIQVTESFVRLKVTADAESTILDLAYDARLTDPTETDLGRTLSLEELAADKTLALFGRAAARDFIDADTLTQRFELDEGPYDELRTRITDWARSLADSPAASTDQLGDLDQTDDRGPGRDR